MCKRWLVISASTPNDIVKLKNYLLVQLENSSPEVQQFTAHEIEEENADGAVLRARQGFTVHVLADDLAKDAAYRKLFIRHASTAVRFRHEGAVSVRDEP